MSPSTGRRFSPTTRLHALWERARRHPVGQRLYRGAVWSLAGTAVLRVGGIIVSAMLFRILGDESFGVLGLLQSTAGLIGTFAGLGLGATATKYLAELRQSDPVRVATILRLITWLGCVLGAIATFGCYLGADFLASRVFERPDLAPLLRWSSLLLIGGVIEGTQSGALAGFEAFHLLARVAMISSIGSLLVVPTLALSMGLPGAVYASLVVSALGAGASVWFVRREAARLGLPRIHGLGLDEWPIIYRYALPAAASGVLVTPVLWVANVMLVRTPGGLGALGVVNVVNTWRNLVGYLPGIILAPAFAIMSASLDNPTRLSKLVRYCVSLSALLVLPAGIFLTAIGHHGLTLIYGPQMASAGTALAWAMIIAGIQATGTGIGNLISASGRMWLGFAVNLLWAIAFLGLAAALIPWKSGEGMLAAMSLAYLISVLVVYSILARTLPELLGGYPLLPVLGGYVVLIGLAWLAQGSLHPIISIILATVLATGVLAVLARLTTSSVAVATVG